MARVTVGDVLNSLKEQRDHLLDLHESDIDEEKLDREELERVNRLREDDKKREHILGIVRSKLKKVGRLARELEELQAKAKEKLGSEEPQIEDPTAAHEYPIDIELGEIRQKHVAMAHLYEEIHRLFQEYAKIAGEEDSEIGALHDEIREGFTTSIPAKETAHKIRLLDAIRDYNARREA